MDLIWINLNHRFKTYVGESSLDLAQIHQIRSPPGLKKKLKIIGQKFVISSRHTLIKPNDKILVCFHKVFVCFKFMLSIYLFYVHVVHLFVRSLGFIQGVLQ